MALRLSSEEWDRLRERRAASVATSVATPNARAPVKSDAGGSRRSSGSTAPLAHERDVLAAILALCKQDPRVAWAVRINSGGAWLPGRAGMQQLVRFGFRGCSDIIGQLRGGHFFACEVKRPGGKPTPDQAAFLANVKANGGLALVASSVDDVLAALDAVDRKDHRV